jgi:hypothetical protein
MTTEFRHFRLKFSGLANCPKGRQPPALALAGMPRAGAAAGAGASNGGGRCPAPGST